MSDATTQIVNKAWNRAHVLRDDGLSYMAYTEPPVPEDGGRADETALEPEADRPARRT